MATKSPKSPREEPDQFLRIMQFQSWFFLGVLLIDVIYMLIKGLASGNGIFSGVGFFSLLFALLSMIGTGLSFGLSYQIQNNPAQKKIHFTTFFVAMALVAVIAVGVLSAYQW